MDTVKTVTLCLARAIFLLATNTDLFGTLYDRSKMYDADIALELSKNLNVKFVAELMVKLNLRQKNGYKVNNMFYYQ